MKTIFDYSLLILFDIQENGIINLLDLMRKERLEILQKRLANSK
jgi:hypothetical protein